MTETVRLLLWLRYRTMFRGGSGGRKVFAMLAGLLILVPLSLGVGVLSLAITRHVAGRHRGDVFGRDLRGASAGR